jgi:Pyruvate/2-oxoacid:ferredoxin oxidoreductase delta subunit
LPNRDEFEQAVREALSEEELEVVLLVPPGKGMPIEALERRAARAGISRDRLHRVIDRLLPQGFLASYVKPEKSGVLGMGYGGPLSLLKKRRAYSGRIVMRLGPLILTEIQARRPEDDAMRRASAHWMNAMIEDAGRSILNKTPYKRVLAVEEAVPAPGTTRIEVNEPIPDARAVLPIDVLSEMLKKEEVIAVADCYCRSTKKHLGEGCDHPLRTCFYFDEIALMQISSGRAERIDLGEAMAILRECEDAGLVHTVDNNRDRIGVLCNCCACSCPLIKSRLLGGTNVAAPSRFVVAHDPGTCQECGTCAEFCPVQALLLGEHGLEVVYERCIGCGVCVSKCPADSMRMVLREQQLPLAKDAPSLERRIAAEALLGMVKARITGEG